MTEALLSRFAVAEEKLDQIEADVQAAFDRASIAAEEEPIVSAPPTASNSLADSIDAFDRLHTRQVEQLKAINDMNRETMSYLAEFLKSLGLADLAYQRQQLGNILAAFGISQVIPDPSASPESPAPQ